MVDVGKGLVDFQFHHGGCRKGFCKFSIVGQWMQKKYLHISQFQDDGAY